MVEITVGNAQSNHILGTMSCAASRVWPPQKELPIVPSSLYGVRGPMVTLLMDQRFVLCPVGVTAKNNPRTVELG